jgi:phosphoribosylcarboxyaminoimidazole (NCAIR) mutase
VYRRAAVRNPGFFSPTYWVQAETVNVGSQASQVYWKAAVTSTIRPGNVRYPAIAWTDLRGSCDIYYSTRGGVATFLTQPAGLNILSKNTLYSTPVSFEWIAGMLTNFTAPSIQNGLPGIRYVFNNWTGGWMAGWQGGSLYTENVSWTCDPYDLTITAYYDTEYYLTVSSTHGTTTGEGWYSPGAVVYAGLTAGIVPGGPGERFVFQSWGDDASGLNYWLSDPITMTGAKTATANWQTEYYLTVTSAQGTPSGTGWYVQGTTAYAGLDTDLVDGAPGERFVFLSWGGDASGTGYAQSDAIIMNAPKTAVANWQTQYYLTVSSTHGTTGGEAWYDEGSTAYASLSTGIVPGGTGTRYVFLSWAGDASGANYAQSNPIIMTGARTATVNWQSQHYLTVSSAHATPSGGGWYADGTTAYASLDTGTVAGSAGQQFVFLSWTGDATGTDYAWSDPITMTGPKTATATWETQYYLTVTSTHGTPTGEGWYASGTSAYAGLDTGIISVGPAERLAFQSWSGDASGTNYAQSNAIVMSAAKSASALWSIQYYITVTSARGAPTPSAWVNALAGFQASVTSPTDIVKDTSRWVCPGHRVDGGLLVSSATCVLTNVGAPHTIAFEWTQQFHLTTQISPASLTPVPTVTPAGEWFNNGTSVTLTGASVTGYVFDHWVVDGVAQETGRNLVQLTMDAAHLATAYYNEAPPPAIPGFPIEAMALGTIMGLGLAVTIRRRTRGR